MWWVLYVSRCGLWYHTPTNANALMPTESHVCSPFITRPSYHDDWWFQMEMQRWSKVFKLVIESLTCHLLDTHVCICVSASSACGRRGGLMIHVEALTILPFPALFARRAKAYLTKYPDTQQPMVFIAFLSANPTVSWCILILCRRWQGVCCIRSFIIFISSHVSTPCRVVFVCFSMFFSGCEDGWFSCCRHQGLLQWFLGENGHYII